MTEEVRSTALKLMEQKDRIEREIEELTSILQQQGVGMTESLVDAEDFPLNNVDVYQVRQARQKIICLQNDHKAIMKQIELALENYYNTTSSSTRNESSDVEMSTAANVIQHTIPFALVTFVTQHSPADYAGIQAQDLILEFGSVNKSNFRDITDVAAVVQHSEGQLLNVKLQRGAGDTQVINTRLIPKKWSGKGLLGCNIVSL